MPYLGGESQQNWLFLNIIWNIFLDRPNLGKGIITTRTSSETKSPKNYHNYRNSANLNLKNNTW